MANGIEKMILYHGSSNIIEKPVFGGGKLHNDYGQGFYCTENIELAKEWACSEKIDGYANKYEIKISGLKILDLASDEFTVLNWLAMLMQHRNVMLPTPLARRGHDYLIKNFLPDCKDFDAIIGYRADDSYFSFVRAFIANEISLNQLKYAMTLGKLGEQFVLKSQKSFEQIKFLASTLADNSIYYAKRKTRDDEARAAFKRELENEDLDGIFMRDILREEMKPNDPRLC